MQHPTPLAWRRPVWLCFLLPFSLHAQLLTESFSYGNSAAALTSLTSNWTAHSGSGSAMVQYQTTGLNSPPGYPDAMDGCMSFTGGSGSREDIYRNFTTQTSGCIYAAALVNISSAGTADYFFHFNLLAHVGRVAANTGSGNLRFGIGKTTTPSVAATNFNANTTYLMVVKYEIVSGSNNDVVSLWILSEPVPTEAHAGSPLASDANGSDPSSLVNVAIRQGTTSAAGLMDELRVATCWEEAVGTYTWNGSWTPATPGSGKNLKIDEHLSLSSDLQCRHLNLASGKTISLNGYQLKLNGAFTGTGQLNGSSESGLRVCGQTGSIGFATNGRLLKTLVLDSNASLTLTTPLSIAGGGHCNLGKSAQLNTGDSLCFRSDSLGTARLNAIGTGAQLNGRIGVERYLPPRRAFRFLTAPVTTSNGISNAWQQQIHITGSGIGFDSSASSNPSLFSLNSQTQQWVACTNTQTQNLEQGKGYRLLVRGDRDIDLGNNVAVPNSVILQAWGTHTPGDWSFTPATAPALCDSIGGYALIGNPYPAPISWNTVARTQISATYYTWRAQGGSNNKGAYVCYNASGQASSDGDVNDVIGSGMAFMVQTTGSNPQLLIRESDKVATSHGALILGKNNRPEIRIQVVDITGVLQDALLIYEDPRSSEDLDEFDSKKWMNPGPNLYSFDRHGNALGVQGLPNLNNHKSIELGFEKSGSGRFEMQFILQGLDGKKELLFDRYRNQYHSLSNQTHFSFTVNEDPESYRKDRFVLTAQPASGISENEWIENVLAGPNPSDGILNIHYSGMYPASLNLYHLQGDHVYHQILSQSSVSLDLQAYNKGIYLLEVQTPNQIFIRKIILKP